MPDHLASTRLQLPLKILVLTLAVAALGLPINHLFSYALLLIAVVVLAVGQVTRNWKGWLAAVLLVMIAIAGRTFTGAPKIEEGHNVFLPGSASNSALVTGLPPDVYRFMAAEFDASYPADRWCLPHAVGCWQGSPRPSRVYAFSFDGLYDRPAYSRRVTSIGFSDAIWQRLGFVNENYNWFSGVGDLQRAERGSGLDRVLHPWRMTMPYFVMYRFPAELAGSTLCWRGTVLWERGDERFDPLTHEATGCRRIAPVDVGKRVFGIAIRPASLAMELRPTWPVQLRQIAGPGLALVALVGLLFLLLRWQPWQLRFPAMLIGLALAVIALHDVTFLGGVRPFNGGDDGLVYDAWARTIVQRLFAGDIAEALQGGENVFHFTPGMRYLRAAEHMIFGETYFGAVSLMLLLPFLVFALFRRYFQARLTLAMTLIFIALPVGALFGSTYFQHVKWAARGFADPAAAVFFLAGLVLLIGRTPAGPGERFAPAFGAGIMFALALLVRPNLAPGAAVLLGGAGLAALWRSQFHRLAGLCIGFAPVFSAALHNWYYGGVFVLFSGHLTLPEAMPTPPSTYLAALGELLRLDFSGSNFARGARQIALVLTGPSESLLLVPLHAAALLVVVRVLLTRRYEGWLRLIAGAVLALHSVALFFLFGGRYHFAAWLLTLLICTVWARDEGIVWLRRRWPGFIAAVEQNAGAAWLASVLDRSERAAGWASRA